MTREEILKRAEAARAIAVPDAAAKVSDLIEEVVARRSPKTPQ